MSSRDDNEFREGSKPIMHFQLYRKGTDNKLTKLTLTELSALTLTYFLYSTGAIINSRNAQNIKNANNVTVSQTCDVAWSLQTSDTTCQVSALADGKLERHEALFEWVTTDGLADSRRETIWIERDSKV